MATPLVLPELLSCVISFVDRPVDLLHCSMVNSMWTEPALQMLYRGSLNDMRFCTPDLDFLNSLFIRSERNFARNIGFVKHMTIAAKRPVGTCIDDAEAEKKTRDILCGHTGVGLLLHLKRRRIESLAIPNKLVHEDISTLRDMVLHPDLRSLTIDHRYCSLLSSGLRTVKGQSPLSVSQSRMHIHLSFFLFILF